MKLRVGIFFGGNSREREISFAGGRTVYDNLNKSLFDLVPVFVDSFGNFILLDWQYIYKGSIRDFYPPVDSLPASPNEFQIYAESIGDQSSVNSRQSAASTEQTSGQTADFEQLTKNLGKRIKTEELKDQIDFAFLCLHGVNGEDGRIQGLFEYLGIPYSGSGVLSSAIGMNKITQRQLMEEMDYDVPIDFYIPRDAWLNENNHHNIFHQTKKDIKLPWVIKSVNQGSSIGISILHDSDFESFKRAVNKSFFIHEIEKKDWAKLNADEKVDFIRILTDIREGIGTPILMSRESGVGSREKTTGASPTPYFPLPTIIFHPEELLQRINEHFNTSDQKILLQGLDGESNVIVEEFIEGREFSCIVIRDEFCDQDMSVPTQCGTAIALPPTEIRKGKELFDYRSKYLPGLSRKITPIEIEEETIEEIRDRCEDLFHDLNFNVYARIDGFISKDKTIYLNDPNTTSGMMPSSFFFHQAAEIGLNPSQFLTYIIRTSIYERISDMKSVSHLPTLLHRLDSAISNLHAAENKRIKVAVIMGGYSSERHISVESGRNIYEKLASSVKYEPVPFFLIGNENEHQIYQIPINLMLKDNADDIKEKILHYNVHPVIDKIIREAEGVTKKYSSSQNLLQPRLTSYSELAGLVDEVFIALHGRPGEDGAVQKMLEEVGLPYNGSGPTASQLTINKYETNELLAKHGFLVARHELIYKDDFAKNKDEVIKNILSRFSFPLIAKPVDDGCSSAVKKIKNEKELIAFANEIFRTSEELTSDATVLHLKPKEEFPRKQLFMIEDLIEKKNAKHFLEITGGLLTHANDNDEIEFEIFEASEALTEGDVLSLEEKFLAGQGQNITPARYSISPGLRQKISDKVKEEFKRVAKILNIEGYARIDAFVRIYDNSKTEVIFIEVNSLPGMTPATCIFHQSAMNGYKPYEFIDKILDYGKKRKNQFKVNLFNV